MTERLISLSLSTGIPSPPLALFIVMLPKAHLKVNVGLEKIKQMLSVWGVLRSYSIPGQNLSHKTFFPLWSISQSS